ncbi:ABC transporter substrate-binding protein [Aquamicrobium segne]|uniref:ABC transporter substrate-binding protein n=1 Tax=Aquamicrobium segne TaxID=469547 RepID=A0ABW0GYP3_9HYPH
MRISRWLAGVATASVIALIAGQAAAQDGKLRIGTEGAYPPFNSLTADGQLEGFDIDIANALCEQMKVECEFVVQDWDGIIPALQASKFDAVVASMSITEERKEQVDFTNKYYVTPLAVIATKDSDLSGTKPEELAGKTIGAQSATTQAIYAQDHYAKAGADVKLYPTQEEAVQDMLNGRLDALVSDKFVLVDWLNNSDEADCCKLIGDVEGTELETGIAIRKGEDELREKINSAIDAIVADGTYQKIQSKYFNFDIY